LIKTIQAYKALEKLLADGAVRSIGVSNFNPVRLQAHMGETDVVPAVNQIELAPLQHEAGPPGSQRGPRHPHAGLVTHRGIRHYRGDTKAPLTDPTNEAIADGYGKTPAQAMFRWHIQQSRSAIPKSVRRDRIAENFDVFDFVLRAEELAGIDALHGGDTMDPDQVDFNSFGLTIPEA
jgi:2,5-diketo-D-gluconate reductase A